MLEKQISKRKQKPNFSECATGDLAFFSTIEIYLILMNLNSLTIQKWAGIIWLTLLVNLTNCMVVSEKECVSLRKLAAANG